MLSVIILLIILLIIIVWIFVEAKRAKHKFIAVILIILIIFSYLSISYVFKNKVVDYKTVSGLMSAGKIYFSWLGYAFGNVKMATSNAIKMNWQGNSTSSMKSKK